MLTFITWKQIIPEGWPLVWMSFFSSSEVTHILHLIVESVLFCSELEAMFCTFYYCSKRKQEMSYMLMHFVNEVFNWVYYLMMIYEDSGYVTKSYKRHLTILRNFLACSFAEGLVFMHKGCASTLHSLLQVLCAHSICVFEILSKYIPQGFHLSSFQSCFQRPCLNYMTKENDWVETDTGVTSSSGL